MTGTELHDRRLALGLSQEKLARALSPLLGQHVAANTVARWERDERHPTYPAAVEAALATLERQQARPA